MHAKTSFAVSTLHHKKCSWSIARSPKQLRSSEAPQPQKDHDKDRNNRLYLKSRTRKRGATASARDTVACCSTGPWPCRKLSKLGSWRIFLPGDALSSAPSLCCASMCSRASATCNPLEWHSLNLQKKHIVRFGWPTAHSSIWQVSWQACCVCSYDFFWMRPRSW